MIRVPAAIAAGAVTPSTAERADVVRRGAGEGHRRVPTSFAGRSRERMKFFRRGWRARITRGTRRVIAARFLHRECRSVREPHTPL